MIIIALKIIKKIIMKINQNIYIFLIIAVAGIQHNYLLKQSVISGIDN